MKLIKQPFKPKAKLLLELGNHLIKDEGIALFELVKNSYDADATDAVIEMRNIDSVEKGEIVISDNGTGMSLDTVLGVWLEPGTDYRQKQVNSGLRTKKFKRIPLGEKGIGRFGAHKLGKKISVQAMYAYDAFTIPANLAGICGGVVPAGKIKDIPVGIQVLAKAFDETTMFQVMKQLEDL